MEGWGGTHLKSDQAVMRSEPLISLDILYTNAYIVVIMSEVLGEFEQVVLLAVLRLGEEAYGVSIRQEILECTDRNPTPGALYTVLERLEGKGMVTSRMGDATPERGGKPKRYFEVTKEGIAAVTRAQRAYQKLLKGLQLSESVHA